MELYPWAASHPILFTGLVGLSLVLLAAGTRRLFVGGNLHALVAIGLLLPAPVAYAVSTASRHHLFEWYLLFLLPGVVAATALGLDGLRLTLSRSKIGAMAGVLLVAGLIGGYVAYTTPQRAWLLNRPIQQIRESAEATRPTLDPFAKENQNVLTASFIGPPDPYDANIILFHSVRELIELISRSDEEGKVLFINFGFLTTAQIRFRPILDLLNDATLFEKTAELQGFDPINDRYVYRYRSGSGAGRHLVEEFEPEANLELTDRPRAQ
jgi:hypothetical protein